jgi:divalent metal cation (Fe/Co/Zn/Cd) transporter
MSSPSLPVLPVAGAASPSAPDREGLVRRARLLAWIGLGWHVIEAAVAIAAGVIASSVALVGFGADSLIEAAAGLVVIWLMAGTRSTSAGAERRAQQLIAASFLVLAAYIGVEALRDLIAGHHPQVSWVGIALSLVTLATMPPLAGAKRRVGERLGSPATASESRQTMLCAYLSAALLVGLVANAAIGWWWADPAVALAIAGVAGREAREAWRGESCSCC